MLFSYTIVELILWLKTVIKILLNVLKTKQFNQFNNSHKLLKMFYYVSIFYIHIDCFVYFNLPALLYPWFKIKCFYVSNNLCSNL